MDRFDAVVILSDGEIWDEEEARGEFAKVKRKSSVSVFLTTSREPDINWEIIEMEV